MMAAGRRITRRGFLTTAAAGGFSAAAGACGIGAAPLPAAFAAPARRGGTLRIAEVGEPLTLDTVATTAGLTSTIMLPVYEGLFAFDDRWRIQPLLVSSYTVSRDSLTYTFTLRGNVPFHNGATMGADDVVGSLNRWGKVSAYGPSVYRNVESVSAAGTDTVVMKLKTPVAPLLAFLALSSGPAVIMPKEIADAAGTLPLRQFVGTGPYRFVEWAPDRYVHLTRFDQYAPRTEPPSGYAGRKDALATDIYYYPVAQVEARIAGVQSGDYDIADQINQDAYSALKVDPRVDVGLIRPGSFLAFFFNEKQGLMTNQKLRQAVAAALDMESILRATYGNPDLYALDPSLFPKGTPWYTTAGASLYDVNSVDRARELAQSAGYGGQPIRWLTTQQYDWAFKSTVVAASQLQLAGFQVDMQVLDWATVLDHRARPADWDVFVTTFGFVPDPALALPFSSAYPGWWDTPTKDALFAQFNAEPDPRKRVQLWTRLQALMYEEAPIVRPGTAFSLMLSRKNLPGFTPRLGMVVWNVEAVR